MSILFEDDKLAYYPTLIEKSLILFQKWRLAHYKFKAPIHIYVNNCVLLCDVGENEGYGISHGFDITHDLLVMAWHFKEI